MSVQLYFPLISIPVDNLQLHPFPQVVKVDLDTAKWEGKSGLVWILLKSYIELIAIHENSIVRPRNLGVV